MAEFDWFQRQPSAPEAEPEDALAWAKQAYARLKAQQLYEQLTGNAQSSLGAAFWELRFPKG